MRQDGIRATDIALVGMACRFPGASTVEKFWQNLQEGRDTTTFFSDEQLLAEGISQNLLQDPLYVKAGQILPDMQAPPLPPYAWPTYAPYNNVSRVAYPQAYPYNAFPFIGPYYPFPKVPLGWRKVTLEWEDGHWYLGRNSAPHDYWRVKFW